MLGLDNYGSDDDTSQPSSPQPAPTTKVVVPRKHPKKIAIALPALPKEPSVDEEDEEGAERPLKKRKTGGGSSLLSMLPTPKQRDALPAAQRVLGGGSKGPMLNLPSIPSTSSAPVLPSFEPPEPTPADPYPGYPTPKQRDALPAPQRVLEGGSKGPMLNLPIVSSAPVLPSFEPPEPTPTDPYPGYYQLPSGAWAAYDTEYYGKFMKKWQDDYNAHLRALEKGAVKGFEGLEVAAVGEVDALKEMERAKKEIQEREEKKAITMGAGGAPAAPRMTMTVSST